MPTPNHLLQALTVTYLATFLCCAASLPFISPSTGVSALFKGKAWPIYVLGFAIVLLEAGYILAFRAGWNLGYAALFSNVAVALILLPTALPAFKQKVLPWNFLGIILAVTGMYLMMMKKG